MDLDDMVARCENRYRDPNNEVVSPAEWEAYINEAYEDVLAANPFWPFLRARNASFTYTAQAASVALPGDAFRVRAVFNATDRYPLTPLEGATSAIDAYPFADSDFGNPLHYRIFNNEIEVYPRPATNATLLIEFEETPAPLIDSTDEPVFPRRYHNALVSGALARAYEDDANVERAAVHWSKFVGIVEAMKDALLSTQTERYPALVDTWDDLW